MLIELCILREKGKLHNHLFLAYYKAAQFLEQVYIHMYKYGGFVSYN